MTPIENKQRELISRHKSFTKWMLKHTPEILESERGRNFIAECEDIEAELAALRQQPKEERFGPDFVHSKSTIDTLKVEQPKETIRQTLIDYDNFMATHDFNGRLLSPEQAADEFLSWKMSLKKNNIAKTETDTGKLIDMPETKECGFDDPENFNPACDKCGHQNSENCNTCTILSNE